MIDNLEEGHAAAAPPAAPTAGAATTNAADSGQQPVSTTRGLEKGLHLPTATLMVVEKWHAWRASRQILDWYKRVSRDQPQLAGRTLYAQVVIRRSGVDAKAAAAILLRAEESFCDWPSGRELRFRDVVLYLVIDEYLRSHALTLGTQTNMGKIVSRVIPRDL